jgi:hypothetical protein
VAIDATTVIAAVGVLGGLTGGGVALFNSRKAVRWKRAELASNFLKDFNSTPELVFAARCLDWYGGKLVLPENLRPYMPNGEQFIQHDPRVFAQALRPDLTIQEMEDDPRIQIYRTSIDSFLSWLSLVASALDRKLFVVADLQDVGYWVAKIQKDIAVHPFIIAYGYQQNMEKLIRLYGRKKSPYKNWIIPFNKSPEQIFGWENIVRLRELTNIRFTHVKGKVTDASGRPIEGAQVEMKTISGDRDHKVKTDPDGSFDAGITHAPFNVALVLTVSKDGYKTFERRFKSEDAKQFPLIALEAVQSVGQSK